MGQVDWGLEVERLSKGELSFDDGLAILKPADPAAGAFGALLAGVADARQARALVDRIHADPEPSPSIQYAVGTELVRRGHWRPVFEQNWMGSLIVEFLVAGTELDDFEDMLEEASWELEESLDDPDTNPLSMLGVKHFITRVEPGLRESILDWLVTEVGFDLADGFFDDLQYEHGQVDPTIELARCLIVTGAWDEGLRYLEDRDAELPKMWNVPELGDVAAIYAALPEEHRAEWGPRFAKWAAAGTTSEGESLLPMWSALVE